MKNSKYKYKCSKRERYSRWHRLSDTRLLAEGSAREMAIW